MKKTCRLLALLLAALLLLPAGSALAAPAIHAIDYPENYPTALDGEGASAYGGTLDHPESRYFIINDYYNMKSGGTLHILSGFETYQQKTLYFNQITC